MGTNRTDKNSCLCGAYIPAEGITCLTDGQTEVITELIGKRTQIRMQGCLTPSTGDAFSTTTQLPQGIVGSSMICLFIFFPKLTTNKRRFGRNPHPGTTLELLLLSGVCV